MFAFRRRTLLAKSTRRLLESAKAGSSEFTSSHTTTVPGQDNSMMGRFKSEFKKMLKLQLFLIPFCIVFMVFMFPTPTVEEEKRMRIEYEKNAGWKT